ncbi:hypothetical protein [Rufibacter sp. LB8]|uniref:hypothetical protein n=1 Tax=Rufibacter sp. LB8 TaxID=2777781 RepID=UPI00178C5031|nr:hypothetical protein [Rufibacter sp. LB8]
MKNKILIFAAAVVLTCLGQTAQAQQASNLGVGARVGGFSSGVSVKYFYRENVALEGVVGTNFGRKGFHLLGLYELHAPAFNVRNLQWFYGAGAHVGSYKGRYYHERTYAGYNDSYDKTLTTMGIDGIVGLEYKIAEIPIQVSTDFKPFLDVNRDGLFLLPDWSLTVRYSF